MKLAPPIKFLDLIAVWKWLNSLFNWLKSVDATIPPSYTTTERDLLDAENGMMIFNTTVSKHQGYDGTSWNNLY